jgi:hypothetical protein
MFAVFLVLLFFLGSFEAALLTAVVVPLSLLFAFSAMHFCGITASLLSLGAIDFGIIVDGTLVMVEYIVRRLREHRSPFRSTAWGAPLAYAATLLAVAGAGYGVLDLTGAPPDPTSSVVATHNAVTGNEVYGDVELVSTFLKEHAPFQTLVPIGDREGVRLIGARVTRLGGGTPAVVYLYDVGGRRMTVAQYPAPEGGAPSGLRLGRQNGLTVATFPEGGLVQTLVGDVPEREVPQIIPASLGN